MKHENRLYNGNRAIVARKCQFIRRKFSFLPLYLSIGINLSKIFPEILRDILFFQFSANKLSILYFLNFNFSIFPPLHKSIFRKSQFHYACLFFPILRQKINFLHLPLETSNSLNIHHLQIQHFDQLSTLFHNFLPQFQRILYSLPSLNFSRFPSFLTFFIPTV